MTAGVVIIGAGVIGCAVARELARRGLDVVVVDGDQPGSQASWAAAGMLSPQAEAEGPGALLDLLLESRALFPPLVSELREETGIDAGYRADGTLLVAFSGPEEAALRERHAWQSEAGLKVEVLSGKEARELEPLLASSVRLALRFPHDHQVDNRLLTRALWFSAAAAGAEFQVGTPALSIEQVGGSLRVELRGGDRIDSGLVVLAAGSWSSQLEGLPRPLPVEPVGGQLLALETVPPVLHHVIGSPRGYMVPRADGRLIVGTTVERTGFRSAATAGGLQRLTGIALELAPRLASHAVAAHWSGLRPGTPDGLPILGPDPDLPGLLYATGHYRNGILLSAITAKLIGCLAAGEEVARLAHFRADRF